MAISKSAPMRFTCRGLADAFDATDEFQGACQSLANLIFDNSNPEIMIPRPGVVSLSDLAALGFANPTFISIQVAVGSRVYGMVATTRNAGHDEPFCLDVSTGLAISIGGVTAANTPSSPATSGDWVPPTIASVGVFLVVTHPGFSGVGTNFFGLIDLTNPAVPVWSSSNTAPAVLTAVPHAVSNLNNRAYYAVKNQLQYSDVLLPAARAAASQALVVGDSSEINALSGLPIQTTSSGIVGALVAFKPTQTWQVTGDVSTVLGLNFISLTVGTNSPRTVAQSPLGVYFLSTAGPYFIDPLGAMRSLTNRLDNLDPDLQTPFINAITPTRWAGAYNSSIYRVCGPTVVLGQTITADYWFDEHKRRWTGPHSFAYDCASALDGYFVLTSVNTPGKLSRSQSSPQLTSVYTDLGSPYNVGVVSATFPKVGDMAMKQVSESQIELGGLPLGASYTVTAQDELGNELGTAVIDVPSSGVPTWGGGGTWGGGLFWTTTQSVAPKTYPVPWTAPLVFEKMRLVIEAVAAANLQIGTFYARYQKTGYMVPTGQ